MNINEKISEQISVLNERPKMLITGKNIDYNMLKCYVDGYIDGLGHAFDKPLIRNITRWFEKKIDMRLDVYWSCYLPIYYKTMSDHEHKIILLNTLNEYFKENPNWYNAATE